MPRLDEGGDPYAPGTTFSYDPATGTVAVNPPGGGQGGGASPTVRDNPGTESYPNQPADGGSSGNAGNADPSGGAAPANFVPPDVGSFLSLYGLPSDVAAKVQDIFANTSDVQQATALALAYIRGTQWYAKTYPGIQEGIAKGIIGNEADYRAYMNSVNNLTKQYQNRDVGSDELAGYLQNGYTTEYVGRLYAGQAYVGANRNDIQYATGAFDASGPLSQEELTALGNESAGIDSELGQRIQNRLALAKKRIEGVFSGSLATPGLSTANGRLQSTTLGGTSTADVAA